jgi:hypothetical protein
MEPGFVVKGGKGGDTEWGWLFWLALIAIIAVAVYCTARKLIALYKRVQTHIRSRRELRRVSRLPEGAEPLAVSYPRCADAVTRDRCYAEAEQDRRRGMGHPADWENDRTDAQMI